MEISSEDYINTTNTEFYIDKIDTNKTYNITDVKQIRTKYGKKYILITDKGEMWAPSNMIKILIKYPKLKHFKLTTKESKTYISKNGFEYTAPEFLITDMDV